MSAAATFTRGIKEIKTLRTSRRHGRDHGRVFDAVSYPPKSTINPAYRRSKNQFGIEQN